MNENFVTFEVSKKLKEKGFPLVDYIPTISQVLKWLREEKEIMVFPVYSTNTSKWYCVTANADSLEQYKLSLSDSYEQAAIAGIEYVIDNLI